MMFVSTTITAFLLFYTGVSFLLWEELSWFFPWIVWQEQYAVSSWLACMTLIFQLNVLFHCLCYDDELLQFASMFRKRTHVTNPWAVEPAHLSNWRGGARHQHAVVRETFPSSLPTVHTSFRVVVVSQCLSDVPTLRGLFRSSMCAAKPGTVCVLKRPRHPGRGRRPRRVPPLAQSRRFPVPAPVRTQPATRSAGTRGVAIPFHDRSERVAVWPIAEFTGEWNDLLKKNACTFSIHHRHFLKKILQIVK